MKEKDYKNEYDQLLEKYENLEMEFKRMNRELYYIKSSRAYKSVLVLRRCINPLRKCFSVFNKKRFYANKVQKIIDRSSKVAIVPCSFEFDEFVNQRPIDFAKFLADNGYTVIYVAWQWNREDKINNQFKFVHENVFQIPLYDFLDLNLEYSKPEKKVFYMSFPNEIFSQLSYDLRYEGFFIHYDIMDEWEEFFKVGQASWYKKQVEEKCVLEADFVSAVSPHLIDKFKNIRSDISLIPNGYYKKLTGEANKNIALRSLKDGKVNIGYFGHLTDSWFNWDLVFEVASQNKNYIFHFIGYGLSSETEEKMKKYENIKYYGKIPTEQLYQYVKDWNIGIIPFKESDLAKSVDPIKIYEYIYMGLNVIVSGITHMNRYPNTSVIKDAKEFKTKVDDICKDFSLENADRFLEESTWEARFSKFLEAYETKGVNELYEK